MRESPYLQQGIQVAVLVDCKQLFPALGACVGSLHPAREACGTVRRIETTSGSGFEESMQPSVHRSWPLEAVDVSRMVVSQTMARKITICDVLCVNPLSWASTQSTGNELGSRKRM
jgi:hypothetical protein